ncbi:MAG: hypothetical protein QOJ11_967 [Frankiales bacterium]|jgi:hypothetical protein|nr:hypothetical protein [Frankiales bacterium]
MNILTATAKSQGARQTDFTFAVDGELVWVGPVCATDRRDPDGACGCGRAFMGLSSHAATTTAEVRDLPLSRSDVVIALAGYYDSAGYGPVPRREVEREVDEVLRVIAEMPEGTILERRLDHIKPR